MRLLSAALPIPILLALLACAWPAACRASVALEDLSRWLWTAGDGPVIDIDPANFIERIEAARDEAGLLPAGARLRLAPGNYRLLPAAYADPTCGNCEEGNTPVAATLGLRIAGNRIALVGAGAGRTRIRTGAGYGILFEDCDECLLEGVTITGGARDPDPRATDAAVVARRSSLEIAHCTIRDNLGDADLIAENIVGVMGITGREQSRLYVHDSRILRNSWDGIALYRDAEALIADNMIDGVEKAGGRVRGGGRGVGIGVTWNARAQIRRNRVTRYWKGIGIFVDAKGWVEQNVVEEMLTWGISLWDAGKGRPHGTIRWNVIFDTGACGVSITKGLDRPEEGPAAFAIDSEVTGNIVAATGLDPRYDAPDYYCSQCPVAVEARPKHFTIERNLLWNNRRAPDGSGDDPAFVDLEPLEFAMRAEALLADLARQPALRSARCFAALPGRSQQPSSLLPPLH